MLISAKLIIPSRKGLFIMIVCLPSLLLTLNGQSQNVNHNIHSFIDSTQKIYGSSDLLVNGSVYYQPNRLASGNPFLFSAEFEKGTTFTRGFSFHGVDLNYDIAHQQLILLHTSPDGARLYIGLSDVLIDSFLLTNYFFVVPAKLGLQSKYPYMMAVNKGKYRMLIAYNKEFISRYNQRNPMGKFSSTKGSLFLASENTIVKIYSEKTFLKTFPAARKEISTYLRQHKINLLKATPEQLEQLMDFYNQQQEKADE